MATGIDPEAPHGRNPDGTPKAPYGYKQDGTPKISAAGRPPSDKPKGLGAQSVKPGTAKKVGAVDDAVKFKAQANDLIVQCAQGLALGGMVKPELALDAWALDRSAEPLSECLGEIAAQYPVVARVLAGSGKATPFIGLAAALIPLGMQIAENHGALAKAPNQVKEMFEVVPRDELIADLTAEAEEMMGAQTNGASPQHVEV